MNERDKTIIAIIVLSSLLVLFNYFVWLREVPLKDGSVIGCTLYQLDNGECNSAINYHYKVREGEGKIPAFCNGLRWSELSQEFDLVKSCKVLHTFNQEESIRILCQIIKESPWSTEIENNTEWFPKHCIKNEVTTPLSSHD